MILTLRRAPVVPGAQQPAARYEAANSTAGLASATAPGT
jgi:hypothetical protein